MRARLFFLIVFFAVLYSSLVFQIYKLQIKKGDYYAVLALSQNRLAGFLEPLRGNIYFTDRNDNLIPAAINKEFPVIFAVPQEIKNPESVAEALYNIVGINKDELIRMFSKPEDLYELLIKKATLDQVDKIRELNIRGIYIDEETIRFYPFHNLASHFLGFIGVTSENSRMTGRYGLELFYEDELVGQSGKLEGGQITNPVAGKNIYLTIDSNIQTRSEEILKNTIQKFNAESGMAIVMEPKTGKILALGAYPNFDPNSFSEYSIKNFLNPAIQAVYEPGSVMKVITMSAGLDSKKLTPETTFYDSGSLTLDGKTIKNWDLKAHGKVTMTEIIEQSINTGVAYAQKLIGNDLFYNYLVKFGFGTKTGIKLPGELSGNLENLKSSFRQINFATAAFGQGVSVTSIQLINAISAIANGGVLMRPYFNKEENPEVVRRVISPEAARDIQKMMVSAVRKAEVAQIPKFNIAGKTGTAQIPDLKHGGYSDQNIHTYVGFAPAYDSRFIILIRIDKPNVILAGSTVVPAFRELAEFMINYYNIPPDYLE